jgi:hypothetical protein
LRKEEIMQYTVPSGSGPMLTVRHTGQEFPLTQAPVTIGRQPDSTIVLADPQVSRQHATIFYQAGRHVVQDLGSANGTYVNDRRIAAPQALRDGDQLRLGNTIFDVRLAAGGVAPTMYGQAMAPLEAAPAQAAGRQISTKWIVGLLLAAIAAVGIIIAILLLLLNGRGEPAVTIMSPFDGAQIATGGQVVLQAAATGAKDITRLEMSVDGQVVAMSASPDPDGAPALNVSHSFTFDQPGPHTISATAYTASNPSGETASVGVTVGGAVGQVTVTATSQATPTSTVEVPTPTETPQPTNEPPTATNEPPTSEPPTNTPTATNTPTHTPTPTLTPTPTPSITPTPTPVIEFWADATSIPAGGSTTLRWHVEHVSAIYLDGTPVTGPDGSQLVAPVATTIYRLRVVYPGGEVTKEVTITVTPSGGSWTHPIRVASKRAIFYLRLTGPGQIRAYADWTGTQGDLALIINGPGQEGYYAREDGPTGTEVVYNVTGGDFSAGDTWRVAIASFGDGEASGTVYLTYPSGSGAAAPGISFTISPDYGTAVNLIVLHGAGAINGRATWSGSPGTMALIINGPGQVGYYARNDGGSPLTVSYSVTPGDLGGGDLWRVSLTSFSAADADGSIEVTYP